MEIGFRTKIPQKHAKLTGGGEGFIDERVAFHLLILGFIFCMAKMSLALR